MIANAPISTPMQDKNGALTQTWLLWLNQLGSHLNKATTAQTNTGVISSINGALTYITYTGLGGFTYNFPNRAKAASNLTVSDGTVILISANQASVDFPEYKKEVTISGHYLNV
jgi:hypothetical protein